MEPFSDNFPEHRQHEVSQAEKKRLFLLAGELLMTGHADTMSTEAFSPIQPYYDSNDEIARYRTLVMSPEQDPLWTPLRAADIASLELHYWPERAQRQQPSEPDQINLYLRQIDQETDLFTMKARFDAAKPQVQIANRREVQQHNDQWIELSYSDAHRVARALRIAKLVASSRIRDEPASE